MDAIQNVELANTPEQPMTTTTEVTCPTCLSGTDPRTLGLGVDFQDLD